MMSRRGPVLTLRDPDPDRLSIVAGWARLVLYAVQWAGTLVLACVQAYHLSMGNMAPGWVVGALAVMGVIGGVGGGVAQANFTWTKPRPVIAVTPEEILRAEDRERLNG